MLKSKHITTNGSLFKQGVEEVLAPVKTDKKSLTRLKIQDQVFDNDDSLADTTKWLSLLTTMVSRIYDILPEDQKALLATEDRNMIEYALTQFAATNTRADLQYATEGNALIDKILERQEELGQLIQ